MKERDRPEVPVEKKGGVERAAGSGKKEEQSELGKHGSLHILFHRQ